MVDNNLRQRLYDGDTVVGTFQIIDSAVMGEIDGYAGLDFVIIDQEHGPLTAESSLGLCAGVERGGASPVIRVRENNPSEIQRALDLGASGVQIPQIENKEDAEHAAAAARFDPIGHRGLSKYVRAGEYHGDEDYTQMQNETTAVIVHIEGQKAIQNISDIAAVEGIDVLFIGPYDLSQSLGIPGQIDDVRVEEKMDEICERVKDTDAIIGTYADDPEMANRWISAGAQYVCVSVDCALYKEAVMNMLAGVSY